MLRACRRVLRPGGRLIFHTIEPTPGLAPADRRRANRRGPPATGVRTSYPSLLASAGFNEIEARDDTADYLATHRRWAAATKRYEQPMRAALGDVLYDERARTRRATRRAIEGGLLARFRYSATR